MYDQSLSPEMRSAIKRLTPGQLKTATEMGIEGEKLGRYALTVQQDLDDGQRALAEGRGITLSQATAMRAAGLKVGR